MIVTDDADLAARMRHLSVFGMETAWSREGRAGFTIPKFANLGYNYKMSDIAAAVGVAQMGKIDGFIARRRSLAEYRDHRLAELDLISAPRIDPNAFTVYQSYVAVLDRGVDRNRVIDKVIEGGNPNADRDIRLAHTASLRSCRVVRTLPRHLQPGDFAPDVRHAQHGRDRSRGGRARQIPEVMP